MKKDFVSSWKASKQRRKQRKYRYNAPFHIKGRFLHCNLSKELRKKYGIRSLRVRKGDKVKIMRGEHKKITGKVERVNTKRTKVYVENINLIKKDGNKVLKPLHPSNLQIIEIDDADKRRLKRIRGKESNESAEKSAANKALQAKGGKVKS